ncbi:MAG: lysylphosphatidylglycerol synthase transmembrane domain-containing protein [Vicinamibacterales bacterium]
MLAVKLSVSIFLLVVLFSRIDVAQLWQTAKLASVPWLIAAIAVFATSTIVASWRWNLLLKTQQIEITLRSLLGTFLIATYFNNFLPSNIGGDVVRIGDTARHTNSKTLATTVVLMDRILGLIALVLVAALGATAIGRLHHAAAPIWPVWLWAGFLAGAAATTPAVFAPAGFGRLLRPLTVFHPEWVGTRITTLTGALARFGEDPGVLVSAFMGAILVQGALVLFYAAVAYALHLDIAFWDLAVVVPMSFVVQLLPVSVGGFGVREAFFSYYFHRVGQPIEDAVLLSLVGQALLMLFSLSGLAVYVWRQRHPLNA